MANAFVARLFPSDSARPVQVRCGIHMHPVSRMPV